MTTKAVSAAAHLRDRARQALASDREEHRRQALERQASERRESLGDLIDRLRRLLDIDASSFDPEWVDGGEYGEQARLTIEGVHFSVRHLEYGSVLRAEVRRASCRAGHLAGQCLSDRDRAWAQLGELIERAEDDDPGADCPQCEAEFRRKHPQLPLEPSLAERLETLLRELVREEVAG